jgi:hypothetical protein
MEMRDVAATLRNILKTLATNGVWEGFTMHGQSKEKKAFTKLNLYRVLLSKCTNNNFIQWL